jgi:hypothetical protein
MLTKHISLKAPFLSPSPMIVTSFQYSRPLHWAGMESSIRSRRDLQNMFPPIFVHLIKLNSLAVYHVMLSIRLRGTTNFLWTRDAIRHNNAIEAFSPFIYTYLLQYSQWASNEVPREHSRLRQLLQVQAKVLPFQPGLHLAEHDRLMGFLFRLTVQANQNLTCARILC